MDTDFAPRKRQQRRRRRNSPRRAPVPAANVFQLTKQLALLNRTLAAGRPSVSSPSFQNAERCRRGYTFTTVQVDPPEIKKEDFWGTRLSLPNAVLAYGNYPVSRIHVRVNPLPKFDSTVWVTIRRIGGQAGLTNDDVKTMFSDGTSPVLVYSYSATGVQSNNKLLIDLTRNRATIDDMKKYAVLIHSKDDQLDKGELVVHADVEHKILPVAQSFPF
ncbi:MAG: capsid protein [Sichuan bromovirus]|nr:MAG: capsid protein [Sichuan bromovirus]